MLTLICHISLCPFQLQNKCGHVRNTLDLRATSLNGWLECLGTRYSTHMRHHCPLQGHLYCSRTLRTKPKDGNPEALPKFHAIHSQINKRMSTFRNHQCPSCPPYPARKPPGHPHHVSLSRTATWPPYLTAPRVTTQTRPPRTVPGRPLHHGKLNIEPYPLLTYKLPQRMHESRTVSCPHILAWIETSSSVQLDCTTSESLAL